MAVVEIDAVSRAVPHKRPSGPLFQQQQQAQQPPHRFWLFMEKHTNIVGLILTGVLFFSVIALVIHVSGSR